MMKWYISSCCFAFLLFSSVNTEDDTSNPEDVSTSKFKSVPTTVKTFENDTVLLPCYLDNAGVTYSVRWLKDKQLIADSADHELLSPDRVRLYSNHSIQVTRLIPNDTGEYVCEVVRPAPWSVIRQVHAIEVLYPAEVTAVPEIGLVQVRIGEEVDMACKATGVPQPIVTWMYNGQPMELLVNRARLKFNATSQHMSGTYECVATNGVRDPARAAIQLVVMHPPIVWSTTPWVHTTIGLSSQLECHVSAAPAARVHWFHGQDPLKIGGAARAVAHTRGDRHQLIIRSVKDADLGMYTCKAENRLGMAEAKIFLSGVANVAVFKTDKSKNDKSPTMFTLIWEVDSYSPIIEYNLWFRPYKPRPPAKDGVVMIKEKDDTWTKLTIPGENNEGPVHTTFYVLTGLTPSTAYEAQLISRNRYGWSKPSSIFHFFTRDGVSENKSSIYSPVEEGFIEKELLKANSTDFYATMGSMENEKVSPSSSPNTTSGGRLLLPSFRSCIPVLLLYCLRYFKM